MQIRPVSGVRGAKIFRVRGTLHYYNSVDEDISATCATFCPDGFGPYTLNGNEDVEGYLRRFTSFLFTKGDIQTAPLAAGASAQEQAAHAALVTAYTVKP